MGDIRSATAKLPAQGTHSGLLGRMRSCWGQNPRRPESRVEVIAGGQRQIFKEMQCWLLENNSQELYVCAYIITIEKARRKRIEKDIGFFPLSK